MTLPQSLYEGLKKVLAQRFNQSLDDLHVQSVHGGNINQTGKLTFSNTHAVFCKINNAEAFPNLFLKEQQGLEALRKTGVVRTPKVIACVVLGTHQVLLLEWIENGTKSASFFKTFGEQLAALHRVTNESFGWTKDNYMASVPQQNSAYTIWSEFFVQQRLEPLVRQCVAKKLLTAADHELFKKLYQQLPQRFDDGEKPALLHGDLWSGNFMCCNNKPVLIDPAVYYGHRAMDIAMTTLFGGFDKTFYESYQYHFPLPPQHNEQLQLCNLYPLLIHLQLFGRGYLTSIQQTLRAFL